jgi:hypothetical protein
MLPNPFLVKINRCIPPWEKSSTIICANSVIFTKLPGVNSHPLGENSPNLVTLKVGHIIIEMSLRRGNL